MPRRPGCLSVLVSSALVILSGGGAAAASATRSLAEARERVSYHVRQVETIAEHLGRTMSAPCPRLGTPAEWTQFQDAQFDEVVLLLAHLQQAWVEAKAGGDDEVRREAKAPRRRKDEGLRFVEKLRACAVENGAAFDPLVLWTRVEEEVRRRRSEIALPP
jgi:hypothetical protein